MATTRITSRLAVLDSYRILDTPPEPAFDDIAELAAHVCETPTALVSFVAEDRQWFKARLGFGQCETGLESSVCAHTIHEADILVIEDLTNDIRTSTNPLVTQDDGIRFYAGAPIRVSTGEVLGALCVIDDAPRPGGLTAKQRRLLKSLAKQVVSQLEHRRALDNRDVALDQANASAKATAHEADRWQGMFESLNEGFVLGEAIRDNAGRMIDWRYIEVNSAWTELIGHPREQTIGLTVREFLPDVEDYWIDDPASALETGEAVSFAHDVRTLGRSYGGTFAPVGDDHFTLIFHDLTEHVARERRTSGLLRLSEAVRSLDVVADVTEEAALIVSETLGVDRVAIGWLDAAQETLEIEHQHSGEDVPTLHRRHRLDPSSEAVSLVLAGKSATGTNDGPTHAFGRTLFDEAGSFVTMPIFDRSRTVGLLVVDTIEPRSWSNEDLAFLRAVGDRIEGTVGRIAAEQQQRVLNEELAHRVKNTLAMVQAIATQTMRSLANTEAVSTFSRRLATLASAHDVLLQKEWKTADLEETARAVLEAAGQVDRVRIDGPPVSFGPRATLSTSLLLHELATNAAKYGALSVSEGRVDLSWSIDEAASPPQLIVTWTERNGPPAQEPERTGFGSRLIRMGLLGRGDVDLVYGPSGFSTAMRASIVELS